MFPTADELPAVLRAAFPEGSLPRSVHGLAPAGAPWPEPVSGAPDAPTPKRPSAVMMLFLPPGDGDGAARIVLTRRSTTVRSHRGQIGFAGGRSEPEDASPVVTALRELEEELGVPRDVVIPFGVLPPKVALDGSAVVPVIGLTSFALADMVPAPAEVESVFAAPWTEFTPARDRAFRFNIFGNWRTSHLFELPGRPVWGLTAHILASAELA